jgi:phosphatidylethanolamine/phosphatidyl-N-methylethanolamine N-methyltransferase
MKNQKVVEKIYEKFGPYYNFVFGKLLFQEGRETAIEFLELEDKAKVLEVGVGTGLTLPLYPRDCKVIGVDLSESMLKEAQELILKKKLKNAAVKLMDATKLEFPDNTFDGVLGNLFISATSYPEEALLEMKRVCKPGGMIVLMNHFKSDNAVVGAVESAFNPVAVSLGFKSNLEMEPLLKKVKLKAKNVKKVNMFNLWTAVSMRNEK